MAIRVLHGERTIAGLSETVEGVHNELVLTDQALYIEREKPASSIWIVGVLLSFLGLFGVLGMMGVLSAAHVLARVRLDQLDHVEVRRLPRAIIAVVGILAMVIVCAVVGIGTADRSGPNMGAVYFCAIIVAFVTIACLITMPRVCLIFGSHNARYQYNSKASMAEMGGYLKAIEETRGLFRPV